MLVQAELCLWPISALWRGLLVSSQLLETIVRPPLHISVSMVSVDLLQ